MSSKRLALIMVCIVFGAALLFTTSCAKKQVAVSESTGEVQKSPVAAETRDKATDEDRARMMELENEQRVARQVAAFQNEMIYFDFDRSDLRPEAKIVLQKKAEWLRANPDYRLIIEGHCDERGTSEYNLALGQRRANAAQDYLVVQGVGEARISTISYGEEKPLDPGHDEEAWARNRRDAFLLRK